MNKNFHSCGFLLCEVMIGVALLAILSAGIIRMVGIIENEGRTAILIMKKTNQRYYSNGDGIE